MVGLSDDKNKHTPDERCVLFCLSEQKELTSNLDTVRVAKPRMLNNIRHFHLIPKCQMGISVGANLIGFAIAERDIELVIFRDSVCSQVCNGHDGSVNNLVLRKNACHEYDKDGEAHHHNQNSHNRAERVWLGIMIASVFAAFRSHLVSNKRCNVHDKSPS